MQDTPINNKELKRLVAERGDFLLYETEDFIDALSYVIIKAMKEGRSIQIKDLFTLEPTRRKSMRVVRWDGQEVQSNPKLSIKLKLSNYLKKALNPEEIQGE